MGKYSGQKHEFSKVIVISNTKNQHHEDDQKAQIFDWTGLAIDIQNVFILVAFNPIAVQGSNAKMKVKCPGAGIDNFKDEDIEEILNKCEKSRAMWQQLQVSYRCALPIAKLADFQSILIHI